MYIILLNNILWGKIQHIFNRRGTQEVGKLNAKAYKIVRELRLQLDIVSVIK